MMPKQQPASEQSLQRPGKLSHPPVEAPLMKRVSAMHAGQRVHGPGHGTQLTDAAHVKTLSAVRAVPAQHPVPRQL